MPVEDEYGRRQIPQQVQLQPQLQQQPSSQQQSLRSSPVPQCTGLSCVPASADHRYASDKNLLDATGDRYSERFGSERSHSDRLPSGERYQGVSERYPLGERPQTSISSERLVSKDMVQICQPDERNSPFQADRYHYNTCQRYPERYTPVGSLDRYHHTIDRYQRTSTPTNSDRHTPVDTFALSNQESRQSTPSICSIERYTPTERHRTTGKIRESRSTSADRKTYQTQPHQQYRFDQYERFPPIPCPERFASQGGNNGNAFGNQVSYMEPPSPAPASDRFVPPPPLSPENQAISPNTFPNNAFPSPTAPNAEPRFIPPPPLSPSPTEAVKYSPKKIAWRYAGERYDRYQHQESRYKDRNQYYGGGDKYHMSSTADRYVNNDRYIPPNAHMPVERYVPQQQEPYFNYHQPYERYAKYNSSDPYMRRDLTYHYRLPLPCPPNQYHHQQQQQQQQQRYVKYVAGPAARIQCCQFQEGYQLSKSSPGSSSSSSSVTSQSKELLHGVNKECGPNLQQEMQCQSYQCGAGYHQEKATQCNKETFNIRASAPNVMTTKQCKCTRHSICASPVEYVGASGGRHVCATPPPRGSVGSIEATICTDNCCSLRRSQNSLTVAVWRATLPQQPSQPSPPSQQRTASATPEDSSSSSAQTETTKTCEDTQSTTTTSRQQSSVPVPAPQSPLVKPPPVQRAISLPVSSVTPERRPPRLQQRNISHTQSERLPDRPVLGRSISRKEMIKNYIKKETATFFGVNAESEERERRKWTERRMRILTRSCGPLKPEYTVEPPSYRRTPPDWTPGSRVSGQLQAERPDVLPGPSDTTDYTGQERLHEMTLRRKDSVARMTWDGLSYVVNTLTRHRPRRRSQQSQMSRSFPPDIPYTSNGVEDDSFFEPTSARISEGGTGGDASSENSTLQLARYREPQSSRAASSGGWRREPHVFTRQEAGQNRNILGGSRVSSSLLDNVHDNSNRRQYGMGWVGKIFGRSVRGSVTQDEKIQKQLDDMEDHRPMFTYWVTTVQILVLFISLVCYGFGPAGFDLRSRSGQVLVTSLSLQQVEYLEPANFWLGPRAGDLIHLGAKFAPCMRVDQKISQEIDKIRARERETACCIRNDDSGCVQSSQADCSKTISTWKKWSALEQGPGGRLSGSVCGLDPKFCDAPASVHPYEWPDDITKWPICRKTNMLFSVEKRPGQDKIAEHMVCEVIGHPCCIGIHGHCKITTKEYCDFVRGAFHEEASLCAQVSCLNDVCGMLPFYFPEIPDQFYRLWTSLFLHAGILQLLVTVLVQYFIMRNLEKLTGSLRIGIIYLGSGMAGNLASAIFVPYRADVGPAGSQFGLLACLIVEVLNMWPMLRHPRHALCKLLSLTFVLFLVGLLPWVDNYAHLFGFIFGFLLSYALMPFISFGPYDRHKKIALIWVCLMSAGFLLICLILLFYIIPVYDCKICSYFNCIPFTNDFCASQNINFKKSEPSV